MANVKQLDLFRGLGPSTGGELVDYSAGPVSTDLARTQAGAWLQYRLPFGSNWTAEPGIRLEWNSFTHEASWEPRLRVSKSIGKKTTTWGGVAVQAQTPSHESLQSFDYFHFSPADGLRLRNERSRQIVAGVEQLFGAGFALRVEAYRRRFDRLLVHRLETDAERAARLSRYIIPPDLPPDSAILEHRPTMEAESTGRGVAAGIEMLLKREGERVSGSLAYTFSNATREMYGATFPFDFDRPHAFNAIIGVRLSRRIRLAATWQRASGFPATAVREEVRFTRAIARDGTIDPIYRTSRLPDGSLAKSPNPALRRLSLRNTERLNGYARADVRATYSVGSWEFYGEVLNVSNRWNHVQRIQYSSFGTGLGELVSENNA
jgi:outer membrane cobalamin receptor